MSPRSYTTVSEKSFQHRHGKRGESRVDIDKIEDGILINGVPLRGSALDDFCNWLDPTTKEVCAELEATDELVEELGLAAKKLELRAKAAEDRVRALERSNAMGDATRVAIQKHFVHLECARIGMDYADVVKAVSEHVQALTQQRKELEQRVKDVETTVQKLELALFDAAKQLTDAEAEAKKFQEAGKELVQHNDRHFNAARRLHERVEERDEQLQDRVEELEQLQDRVEELEQLLDTSEANVEDWKEAWQAAMTELTSFALPEEVPICRFYETVRIDVHEGAFSHPAVDAMTLLGVKDAKRFEKHCCRMTFEALFPIGPPADVSKPEGRDS